MEQYHRNNTLHWNKFGGTFFRGKKLSAQKIAEIIDIHLEHPQMKKSQIARLVKCSYNTVDKYLNAQYYIGEEESPFDQYLSNLICEILLHYPQIYLKEIQQILINEMNLTVSKSKLYAIIINQCYFRKKRLSVQSVLRNSERVILLRENWLVCFLLLLCFKF